MLKVAFWQKVIYNHTIMSSFESFEAFEESQVQPQVDAIFDDVLNRPEDERIVRTAFDFLTFFDAEREAQAAVLLAWIQEGHDGQPKLRTLLSAIGRIATGTLESMGRAHMVGSEGMDQTKQSPAVPRISPTKQETAQKEATLLKARMRVESAKVMMPSIYNLTRRQVKQAEAIARNPQRLDRL
ncbi:MAG: hypothetical protein JWO99_716 [Candidatus Saccharibacteria bacterium]|nr:hypothetical protein [Candidatus Saccharibacteria bacterium]